MTWTLVGQIGVLALIGLIVFSISIKNLFWAYFDAKFNR